MLYFCKLIVIFIDMFNIIPHNIDILIIYIASIVWMLSNRNINKELELKLINDFNTLFLIFQQNIGIQF